MTLNERHEEINKILAKFKVLHEKYFPPMRPLTDLEWEKFIAELWSVADSYKGTNLETFAGEIAMAFSNDIEFADKQWKRIKGANNG